MFKKAFLDTTYKQYSSQFSGQRLTSGEGAPARRRVQCGHFAGKWRKERKGSPSQLLLAAPPKGRCLSLGGSFLTCVCLATEGVCGLMALEGEVFYQCIATWLSKFHEMGITCITRAFNPVFMSPAVWSYQVLSFFSCHWWWDDKGHTSLSCLLVLKPVGVASGN